MTSSLRTGVLLVNLGTPSAPTSSAVRRFLAEFLGDARVVDYPRALWLPLLHGIILNVRPARTARNYAKIWRADTNESPLRYYTRAQAENLARDLGNNAIVGWAMRYGEPSIAAGLAEITQRGAGRIVVIPLYPQYSASTNASVDDAVSAAGKQSAAVAPAFHNERAYIEALAARARAALRDLGWAPDRILISFHGLPERYIANGDPYQRQCEETAALLRGAMRWREDFAPLAYQSRFGREKWLGPPTDETLVRLAREGAENVAVIAPGFVSDCVETLEEIAIAARVRFLAAGGKRFAALPCLNDSPEMTALLRTLAARAGIPISPENQRGLNA